MTARLDYRLLDQVRTLATTGREVPDGELVARFVRQGDEAAFEALLRRHGPAVLGVCRRLLRHAQDAEDAFQATFLLLARKAGSLRRQEAVGCWLYGVARRVALKAQARAARQRRREEQVPERPPGDPLAEISLREAQALLDQELLRLPIALQGPLLLCCLEGLTRDEAAARLGIPVRVLKNRLEEGRHRLRTRLARRGLSLSAVLPPACLASEALPPHLLAAGLRAAATAAPLSTLTGVGLKLGTLVVVAGCLLAARLLLGPAAPTRPAVSPEPPVRRPLADHLGDSLPAGARLRLGTLRHQIGSHYQLLPDGRTLVTERGGRLCWIDLVRGTVERAWPLPTGQRLLGLSGDGGHVVLAEKDALSLWDSIKGKRLRPLADRVNEPNINPRAWSQPGPGHVTFSPDGRILAGCAVRNGDRQVFVWDAADGKMLWQAEVPHRDRFRNLGLSVKWPGGSPFLQFLPDGKTIVLLDEVNHHLQFRDRASGKVRSVTAGLAPLADYHWTASPDGKTFLAVNPRDGLRSWPPRAGSDWDLPLDGPEKAQRLAFAGDGRTLLLAGDGRLRVRDWPSGKLRRRIDLAGRTVLDLLPGPDGRSAHVLLEYERTLRRFDLDSGAETTPTRAGHRGIISEFALAPQGKLVSAGYDGSVQVWDLKRGRAVLSFRPKNGCIFMAVSDDGKLVAAVDWDRTEVAVHECDTGRLVRTIEVGKHIRYLAFAPRGRLLLTGEQIPASVFRVWDADTGRLVRRIEGQVYARPAFSPDGKLLAALGEAKLRVIDFARGRERFSLPVAGRYGLAFSADGRTLACGDWKAITLWDVATRKRRGTIKLNDGDCTALRFSPDGVWLAWGDAENIRLWDLRQGRLAQTFRGHEGNVTDLRFTADGRLISSSTDSTLLVWDLGGVGNP